MINLLNKIDRNRICFFLIFLGFFYSIFTSITITNKYDKFYYNVKGTQTHHILQGDIWQYWHEASLFKEDLKKGKPILEAGEVYEKSYLYPKIVGTYYLAIDKNIKNEDGEIETNNYKAGIPIIHSIIFYFVLILFYKKISNKFSSISLIFIIFFISLEPSMFQFHSSYFTESIYLSIMLLLFTFVVDFKKKNYQYLLIGFLLGIAFTQRTVAILIFIPIIIYLILNLKNKALKPSILIIAGYTLIILFLGYHNYKKTGQFYITSTAYQGSPWHYVAHTLNANRLGITNEEGLKKKYEDMNKWIESNEIDVNHFQDLRRLGEYQQKYFIESVKDNFFYSVKYYVYKSMQTLILPLNDIKYFYKRDGYEIKNWKNKNFTTPYKYKIPYSLFVYSISFIGFIIMFFSREKHQRNIAILILLICIYHLGLLGWAGNSRYALPNQIFYSIFFGVGAEWIFRKLKFLASSF